MANCKRCGRIHGCSCQLRIASNGQPACSQCIVQFEQEIAQQKVYQEQLLKQNQNNIHNPNG